jgi:hypothetical protein
MQRTIRLRRFGIPTLLLAALLHSGCVFDRLLVPQLRLPPGSKVVHESSTYEYDLDRPEARSGRLSSRTLDFDCKEDWDTVRTRIETRLVQRGFVARPLPPLSGDLAEDALSSGESEAELADLQAMQAPAAQYKVWRSKELKTAGSKPEASEHLLWMQSSDGRIKVSLYDWAGMDYYTSAIRPGAYTIRVSSR